MKKQFRYLERLNTLFCLFSTNPDVTHLHKTMIWKVIFKEKYSTHNRQKPINDTDIKEVQKNLEKCHLVILSLISGRINGKCSESTFSLCCSWNYRNHSIQRTLISITAGLTVYFWTEWGFLQQPNRKLTRQVSVQHWSNCTLQTNYQSQPHNYAK